MNHGMCYAKHCALLLRIEKLLGGKADLPVLAGAVQPRNDTVVGARFGRACQGAQNRSA
jgi:hypothetical protein